MTGRGTSWPSGGVAGAGAGQFNRPSFIAVDAEDNLLVSDSLNHRVQKYTGDGEFLGQWGEFGAEPGLFNMPWGLALDSQGSIYVCDWRNDRVQKFGPEGRFIASYGTQPGDGQGQFHRPAGVAIDGLGNLVVADWGNERVQVLDQDGKFIAAYRGESRDSLWAQDYFTVNPDEAAARPVGQPGPRDRAATRVRLSPGLPVGAVGQRGKSVLGSLFGQNRAPTDWFTSWTVSATASRFTGQRARRTTL